jgi:hypothetical protein
MDNLDDIEKFFTSSLDPAETREFEKRIETDPDFADEVATYLSILHIVRDQSREEKKRHFRDLYKKEHSIPHIPVRKLAYFIGAAAVVVGLIFGVYILVKPVSPQQLANTYITEHLQTLGVTMGNKGDDLQTGLRLYNDGKTAEALRQFELIIRSDSANFTAKEYAGLAALRLKDYDKALSWFEALETHDGLYANPALFYQSLTLMERNQPGDESRAKQILQQIVERDAEGKETAVEWLKKLQ